MKGPLNVREKTLLAFTPILFLFLLFGFANWNQSTKNFFNTDYGKVLTRVLSGKDKPEEITFVGDVFLGRDVERKMMAYGDTYPYANVKDLLNSKVVVGNFESPIPEKHKATPDLSTQFSVSPDLLGGLVKSGFTHFSLANNHTFDYKDSGLSNTIDTLNIRGFETFGRPNEVTASSLSYTDINNVSVAIVAINTVSGYPTSLETNELIKLAQNGSDLVVVYLHWGDEYQGVHNESQEKYAQILIDAGADLIIGSHPHVVQDVTLYKGRPIFYSLGNFIFDQYFSDEVQIGLLLKLDVKSKTNFEISLIPVDSRNSHSAPAVMSKEDKEDFLNSLALKSSENLREAIGLGKIEIKLK